MAWLKKGGFIYGLKNPITSKFYYVGQTTQTLKDRFRHHLWESKNRNYPRSLLTKANTPEMVLLEDINCDSCEQAEVELKKCEIKWINKLLKIM